MIREATIDDMAAMMPLVFEFHKAANLKRLATYEESEDCWLRFVASCIQSDNSLCLVAEGDNGPVGFCTATIYPAYWNDRVKVAHETTIWVSEDARGKGFGGGLIGGFCDWGANQGVSLLASGSTVYMGPKEMGKMLRKHGFRLDERTYTRRVS